MSNKLVPVNVFLMNSPTQGSFPYSILRFIWHRQQRIGNKRDGNISWCKLREFSLFPCNYHKIYPLSQIFMGLSLQFLLATVNLIVNCGIEGKDKRNHNWFDEKILSKNLRETFSGVFFFLKKKKRLIYWQFNPLFSLSPHKLSFFVVYIILFLIACRKGRWGE